MISGYLKESPWMWIIAAGAFTAASVSHYVENIYRINKEKTTADKIGFNGISIQHDLKFEKMRILLRFRNIANFPITVKLDMIDCSIGNRKPEKVPRLTDVIEVPAHGQGVFGSNIVETNDLDLLKGVAGEMNAVLKYGKNTDELERILEIKNGLTVVLGIDNQLAWRNWDTKYQHEITQTS